MIRVNQIRVPAGSTEENIKKKVSHIINVPADKIKDFIILKKSVDARHKDDIKEIYSAAMSVDNEDKTVKRCNSRDVLLFQKKEYTFPEAGNKKLRHRPLIAGFGPSGMFCAYILALNGYRPIVLERGYDVISRMNKVNDFFNTGRLDPECNIQFGEGGAGTFSDGKLNTLVNDDSGRNRFVLETFVKFGAPESILTDSKPHIGTDKLMEIIPAIRREIERLGGEVRFESKVTDILTEEHHLTEVTVNDSEHIEAEVCFLCLGHSARDTFEMLSHKKISMEPKSFAVGVRVEHQRKLIDAEMGQENASYKVTHKCKDGRGVYSFCMCPGGYVVNASSEEGCLCVNGMSYSKRNGDNSNSAIVVTVAPEDYGGDKDDPLCGIRFQRELERKAYTEGNGGIPYQRYEDFRNNKSSGSYGKIKPQCRGKYTFGNIRNILPEYICDDICEGMENFSKQISGYSDEDTLISAVESRTSSPLRILRDSIMQSDIRGIFPVGEGAGYAGGIMSAAMDGLKSAESLRKEYIYAE